MIKIILYLCAGLLGMAAIMTATFAVFNVFNGFFIKQIRSITTADFQTVLDIFFNFIFFETFEVAMNRNALGKLFEVALLQLKF